MSSALSLSTPSAILVPSEALAMAVRATLWTAKPPPKLTVSEWADEKRILSPEASAEPGRWSTDAQPYQRGMMDTMGDPTIPMMVVMSSSQIGKTEITVNLCGYHIDQDPAPVLVLQPTLDMAKTWSKDRLSPMLRDTPTFRGKVGESRTRDSGNTLLHKSFAGGHITMAGANSPASLASRPIRILICDEVDRYAVSAGVEGDPVSLAFKRTTTFFNRKTVLVSTPLIKGLSRIERAWLASDQRHYHVPCPHCGEFQKLEWGNETSSYGIKWQQDERGEHLPDTAYYLCRNGCAIEEKAKPAMVRAGEWRASAPYRGSAGFHIWAGYSLHINSSWGNLVREWLAAKDDPLSRQTFHNLVLGLPYEDRGEKALAEHILAAKAEQWAAQVPDGVAVLTVGGDTQDDRIELETVGWGRNEERWSIDHTVIEGDPDNPATWDKVDAYLKRVWRRADGRPFEVMATCIDSAGHHTERVYEFSKARLGRRVWAIVGEAARGGARSPVWPVKRPSERNKKSFKPIVLGVNAAKDVIRSRLRLDPPPLGQELAGYMHYPTDRDLGFFAQLVSERLVLKTANGQRWRVWELAPGRRNEALDLAVYSYGALCGLMHFGLKLNMRADEVTVRYAGLPPALPPEPIDQDARLEPFARPEEPKGPTVQRADQPKVRKSILSRFAR